MTEMNKKRIEKIREKLLELESGSNRNELNNNLKDNKLLQALIKDRPVQNQSSETKIPKLQTRNSAIRTNKFDNDQFYEDAVIKNEHEKKQQKRVNLNIQKLASKHKISNESAKIMNSNSNDNVTKAILIVDPQLTKRVDFMQMKKVLFLLKIIDLNDSTNGTGRLTSGRSTSGVNEKKHQIHSLLHLVVFNFRTPHLSEVKFDYDELKKQYLNSDDLYLVLCLLISTRLKASDKNKAIIG